MTISVSGSTITFSDSTTQTTAAVAGVTSVAAGTGISVSASTGAVTITNTNTATGTVTSVATGNGLQGGTITTSGTLSVACPSYNSVGSYVAGSIQSFNTNITGGGNYSAGGGTNQITGGGTAFNGCGGLNVLYTNNLSGTWKWMSGTAPNGFSQASGVACRVS